MKKYLAMMECPALGVSPATFMTDSDNDADRLAFELSLKDVFVTGSYDLYQIVWNNDKWSHELIPVEVYHE